MDLETACWSSRRLLFPVSTTPRQCPIGNRPLWHGQGIRCAELVEMGEQHCSIRMSTAPYTRDVFVAASLTCKGARTPLRSHSAPQKRGRRVGTMPSLHSQEKQPPPPPSHLLARGSGQGPGRPTWRTGIKHWLHTEAQRKKNRYTKRVRHGPLRPTYQPRPQRASAAAWAF